MTIFFGKLETGDVSEHFSWPRFINGPKIFPTRSKNIQLNIIFYFATTVGRF